MVYVALQPHRNLTMQSPSSRLQSLMDEYRLNQTELAEKVGKTKALVNGYLKAGSKPSDIFLNLLEDKLGWSARWIRTGEGSKLVQASRTLVKPATPVPFDIDIPAEVSEHAATYNPERTPFNVSNQISRSSANMWLVPIRAQAGFAKRFEDPVFLNQMQRVPFPMVMGECYGFEVEGRSMEPRYSQFSWVVTKVIDDVTWLARGRNYVFQTYEGIYIKQFDRIADDHIYMVSLNDEYNPVDPLPVNEVRRLYSIEGRFQPGE